MCRFKTKREIVDAVASTNFESEGFPWVNGTKGAAQLADMSGNAKVVPQGIKRWSVANAPIAVYDPLSDSRVEAAIQSINRVFERPIFKIVSVSNFAAGVTVSIGTAVGDPRHPTKWCSGNVSDAPGETAYPDFFVRKGLEIKARFVVNLDGNAKADNAVAVHEFGHVLGLGSHFYGFGEEGGPAISVAFWQVLVTLYHNEPGSKQVEVPDFVLDTKWMEALPV